MKKIVYTTFLVVSGVLALLFLGNFLLHLIFYMVDGSLGKFASPLWIALNLVMILLVGVFVVALRMETRMSSY